MLAISFHTDGVWGTGLDRNLTAAEVDANFYNIKVAVEDIQANPPAAIGIASIREDNLFNLYFTLTTGQELGPFPLALLEWDFKGAWTPNTSYAALDAFVFDADSGDTSGGLYVVMIAHTSGSSFDPNQQVTGQNALKKMMGMDSGTFANIYDVTFFYPGRPSDSTNTMLVDFPMLRDVVLPIESGNHYANLTIAPSSTQQVYPIYHGSTHIGDITFAVSSETGVISWLITADETIPKGDRLKVGQSSTTADPSACGLSVGLACQRVVS